MFREVCGIGFPDMSLAEPNFSSPDNRPPCWGWLEPTRDASSVEVVLKRPVKNPCGSGGGAAAGAGFGDCG